MALVTDETLSAAACCARRQTEAIFTNASRQTIKVLITTGNVLFAHAVVAFLVTRTIYVVTWHAHHLSAHPHLADLGRHAVIIGCTRVGRTHFQAHATLAAQTTRTIAIIFAGRAAERFEAGTIPDAIKVFGAKWRFHTDAVRGIASLLARAVGIRRAGAGLGRYAGRRFTGSPGGAVRIAHTHLSCTSTIGATDLNTRTGVGVCWVTARYTGHFVADSTGEATVIRATRHRFITAAFITD